MHALSIKNLQKTYPNGKAALKGIDFDVEPGDFYALLGPNGAGKTTAIGIICSLVQKTGGDVQIFGHSIDSDLESAEQLAGKRVGVRDYTMTAAVWLPSVPASAAIQSIG